MTGFSFPEGLVATLHAFLEDGVPGARAAWAPWLPLAVFEQQEGLALGIRKEVLRRLAGEDGHPVGATRPPAARGTMGRGPR